jgi:peptide chain release factor 1
MSKNLGTEVLTSDEGHVVAKFSGENVWPLFSAEAGKHVVQRYPSNDRSGRRHTSVVSVAVLPLPPDTQDKIPEDEIEIKTQRGHGKGGQHQNTTDSAVRATHTPTGLSVFINGRDQLRNKQDALKILAQKVRLMKETEAETTYGIERRNQLGGGGRGNKIRTYNFIDHYVKDHRTGKRVSNPDKVMRGGFDLLR